MTYEKVADYTLGDKLKKQFRGRGAALNGMHASSTSELMHMAEMGHDPTVNCAEQAFRNNYNTFRGERSVRSAAYEKVPKEPVHQTKNFDYGRQKNENAGKNFKQSQRVNGSEKSDAHSYKSGARYKKPIAPSAEICEPRKTIPFTFLLILITMAVMFMALIFSICEVYKTTNEISMLENELDVLRERAEMLELELEEKNDIKVIENIASEKLGMVGEESVRRKYISLSNGEHIEVLEEPEEEAAGGVMLSSIFTSLGKFFEKFS